MIYTTIITSLIISFFFLWFYSRFRLVEIPVNKKINYFSKDYFLFNLKYQGIYLLLIALIFYFSYINHLFDNIIYIVLFIIGLFFFIFVRRPFIEGNFTQNEDFKYEKIEDKKEINNNIKKLLTKYIILYIIFGIFYYVSNHYFYIKGIDLKIFLLLPFISVISFTDGKYGLIDDIPIFLLILITFFYKGELLEINTLFLVVSFFIFGTAIYLFEYLFLSILNKRRNDDEKLDYVLGGMDIIVMYLIYLFLDFNALLAIILALCIIILIKNTLSKGNSYFHLFQDLDLAFIIYLIFLNFF